MEDSFEGLDEANADRVKRTFAALVARGIVPFFTRTAVRRRSNKSDSSSA